MVFGSLGRGLVTCWGLSIGLGLVFSSPATAQDRLNGPTTEQVVERTGGILAVWESLREGESGMRVRLEPGLVSSGKFDGSRILWFRTAMSIEGGLPLSDRIDFGISPSFATEQLIVKRSDDFIVDQQGGASTISDFIDGSLSVGGRIRFDRGFGAELATRASVRQEVGASFDESLRVGGSMAATYRRGRWLQLRLGVGLGTDLGDRKLRVSPVYRIVVRPRPDLTLQASGLSGGIEWAFSKKTAFSLSAGVDSTQYKLERRLSPPTGLGDGSLQRKQTEVVFGVTHRLKKWLRISADLGLTVSQELSVLDQDGLEIDGRTDHSVTPTFGLRFEFRL